MDLGISGRKAIVTGSTRGIGLACAEALAAEGVHVLLNARTNLEGDHVAKELHARFGVDVSFQVADVSTAEGRARLVTVCPNPDIVVTNASGPSPTSFVDNRLEQWSEAFDMNFHSAVGMMQLAIPGMRERKFGRIINITSGSVKAPIDNLGLYDALHCGPNCVDRGDQGRLKGRRSRQCHDQQPPSRAH